MNKNSITDQKTVNSLVSKAIKSDKENEISVKTALIHALKLAASNVGRFEAFNDLFNGVSAGTAENIRMYMVNLLRETGIEVTNENGQTRKTGFFRFNKTKGWHHPADKPDAYVQHRKVIDEMPVEAMMKIHLGRTREEVERNAEFSLSDFEDRISRAIKFGLQNNLINSATADRFNGLISEAKRIKPEEIDAENARKLENLQKQAARFGLDLVKTNDGAKPVAQEDNTPAAKAA